MAETRIDSRSMASLVHIPEIKRTSFREEMESALHKSASINLDESDSSLVTDVRVVESSEGIVIRNGAFGWFRDEPPVLQSIDITFKTSQLTMVVGPVASGKSTLLKAILGEVPVLSGSVTVADKLISFCDQTPWLRNATVQQNILGYSNFDSKWYSAVVHACALDDDFTQLPAGDQSLVGTNGITLSGGQKHRIASRYPL